MALQLHVSESGEVDQKFTCVQAFSKCIIVTCRHLVKLVCYALLECFTESTLSSWSRLRHYSTPEEHLLNRSC